MIEADRSFRPRLPQRRFVGVVFTVVCVFTSLIGAMALATLIVRVAQEGLTLVSWHFLTNYTSRLEPLAGGILSGIAGTLWLIGITLLFAVPMGIAAAIYLEEYARSTPLTRLIQLNIANLAGVPSIVYGLLGLAVFVRTLEFGRSVLAGGLTLGILVLPVVIIPTREALAAVPASFRHAAYALGATRWQTIYAHVLPAALPGIMTGIILSLSRAIGEAAPLVVVGAAAYVPFVPRGPLDAFTAIPIQIFAASDAADPDFHRVAAAAIIVLLGILLSLNAVAVGVRMWQQRNKLW